jgi:hypothetical protein
MITRYTVPCLHCSAAVLKGVLDLHNQYRARHGVPPLSWSSSVASTAQSYSRRCDMVHSRNQYGENLAKVWRLPAALGCKLDHGMYGFVGSATHEEGLSGRRTAPESRLAVSSRDARVQAGSLIT